MWPLEVSLVPEKRALGRVGMVRRCDGGSLGRHLVSGKDICFELYCSAAGKVECAAALGAEQDLGLER